MASLSATLPFSSSPLHLRLHLPHHPPLPRPASTSRLSLVRSHPLHPRLRIPLLLDLPSTGGTNDDDEGNNSGGGGGGGGGGDGEGDGGASDGREALFMLAPVGRKLESLPADLAAAVESSPLTRWLLQFGGLRERLLAKLAMGFGVGIIAKLAMGFGVGIIAKLAMGFGVGIIPKLAKGFGVGIIAKIAAEYEKRMENIVKPNDIVIADAVMAIVADFMLAYLPAPTIALAGRSKRQPSVSRSSAKTEYREFLCPIGPMHRQRTKYIELDIHFVLEKVALVGLPVLHVPTSQQADLNAKCLPGATFQGFRASLCVSFGNVATAVGC